MMKPIPFLHSENVCSSFYKQCNLFYNDIVTAKNGAHAHTEVVITGETSDHMSLWRGPCPL